MATPRRNVGNVGKECIRHVIRGGETEDVIFGLPLIKPDTADLYAGFEGMPAMGPDHVIDQSEGCADFNVGRVVVEPDEVSSAYCESQRACLRVMIGRAIDVPLSLIEELRSKRVLQRHQVIRRVIDGLQFVFRQAAAIGRIHQTDVALRPTVKGSTQVDLIVGPYEPCVFMNGSGCGGSDQVGIRIGSRRERGVGISKTRGTSPDWFHRGAPWVRLHDGAHLRRVRQYVLLVRNGEVARRQLATTNTGRNGKLLCGRL